MVVDEKGRNILVGIAVERESNSSSSSSSKVNTTRNGDGVGRGKASVASRGGARKFAFCKFQRKSLAKEIRYASTIDTTVDLKTIEFHQPIDMDKEDEVPRRFALGSSLSLPKVITHIKDYLIPKSFYCQPSRLGETVFTV